MRLPKARVTSQSGVIPYSNAKGAGKRMIVDLLDAEGSKLRATLFNEQVDALGGQLQQNGVYRISGGSLKQASAEYRFRDYYALARATNMGQGFALTEEYRSLPE